MSLISFISLINFRAIFAITAEDDDQYASATKYLEQIENGELGVMMSSGLKKGIETQPYSNGSSSYLTQVIEILQYIKGSFYQEIGLDCNYNMKRERLSESESGLNKDVLRPLIDSMLEERQKALDLVNEKYGTNITIEFNSSWAKYNDLDETIDSDITEEKQEEITEVVDEETTEETVEETTEETVEEIEFTEELVDKVIDKLIEKIDDDKEEEDVNDKGNDADTNE